MSRKTCISIHKCSGHESMTMQVTTLPSHFGLFFFHGRGNVKCFFRCSWTVKSLDFHAHGNVHLLKCCFSMFMEKYMCAFHEHSNIELYLSMAVESYSFCFPWPWQICNLNFHGRGKSHLEPDRGGQWYTIFAPGSRHKNKPFCALWVCQGSNSSFVALWAPRVEFIFLGQLLCVKRRIRKCVHFGCLRRHSLKPQTKLCVRPGAEGVEGYQWISCLWCQPSQM
jgi:hypothetical protein